MNNSLCIAARDTMRPAEPELVSVIIAAYNAEGFLRRALISARAQTYRNLEIIVIDDGSTDDTYRVALSVARLDARIKVHRLAQNGGVSRARNIAMQLTQGAWIAVLDADDAFAPRRIERLVRFAAANQLDLAADNLEMRAFKTGVLLGSAFPSHWLRDTKDCDLRFLLEHDLPGLSGWEIGFMQPIFRTAFLRAHELCYAPGYAAGEDFLLYVDCLRHGARLRFLAEANYICYVRPGSASASRAANIDRYRAHQRIAALLAAEVPRLKRLLGLRGALIGFELFIWHMREGRFLQGATEALRLPKYILLEKLRDALLRRFGMRLDTPSNWVRAQLLRADAEMPPQGIAQSIGGI